MMRDVLMALLVNAAVFSVLFIIMLIIRRLLGKRLSPALMLVLWVFVVIKLLIPYGFESDIGLLAPPQTVAAAPADTGDHIPMTVSQNNRPSAVPQTDTETGQIALNSANLAEEHAYQTTSPTSAAATDWMTLVFGVWAVGVVAVASVFGISTVNIRRRIRHTQLQIPGYLKEVFEECTALLGIKCRVGLCVQFAFGMPMMMGVLRPRLMLPENALMLDKKTLRHIMLHELAHLKRGDLLLIWGLNVLGAVYWFNPLTWLCFKLIRDDIETACDHSVFKAGSIRRLDYIDTILYFAGSANERRLAAAMALSHRCAAMEKRIKGIFKSAKTHTLGRCTAVGVAMLMLCASVLTACQPAKPVELDKADGTLAAISRTAEVEYQYEAPAHWRETVEGEKLRIVFDNDVQLPDTSTYPVIKVEPMAFSQQQIDKLVKYFAGDKKLFLPHIRTKTEYDDEIADAKRGIAFGEAVDKESAEAWAQELEKMRAAAPDDSPIVYTDTTLTYDRDEFGNDITESGKNSLSVKFDNDGYPGAIYARNDTEGYWKSAYFDFTSHFDNYMTESMYQDASAESGETDEQAGWAGELFDTFAADKDATLEKANQVLSDLDIKDMMLISTEKFVVQNAPEKSGYTLEFARQAGGIPVYEIRGGGYSKEEEPPAYASPIGEETVRVWVSKDGIEGFTWSGPSRVVETVSGNVKLLPFEDIQKALIDRISYRKSFYTRGYVSEKAEVKVTSIELQAAYIGVKDNPNQALIVPAWVVESTFTYDNGGDTETIYNDPYVINAIDGGEIGLPRF